MQSPLARVGRTRGLYGPAGASRQYTAMLASVYPRQRSNASAYLPATPRLLGSQGITGKCSEDPSPWRTTRSDETDSECRHENIPD